MGRAKLFVADIKETSAGRGDGWVTGQVRIVLFALSQSQSLHDIYIQWRKYKKNAPIETKTDVLFLFLTVHCINPCFS
jgi:hypothetical protein